MSDLRASTNPSRLVARSRRRLLLGGGLAALATGASLAPTTRAEAAPGTTSWVLGGNTGVSTDASNYLGTRNVAPLVFKTAQTANTPVERMRILPTGKVGIGSTTPTAQLDVRISNGVAVRGQAAAAASTTVGVQGVSVNGTGVEGRASGGGTGVLGSGTFGVYGNGTDYGVFGTGVYGVYGSGTYGIYGDGDIGVYAVGGSYGVLADADNGAAIFGSASGIYSQSLSRPLEAQASGGGGEGIAVFADTRGSTATANKYAGYFVGDVVVFGTLSKSAGSFKIDHPLEPEAKWLSHSFVESPDMMNVYNGNVVLDARGEATVSLPDYFGALNRDYRYQLTCVGAHAPVYVSRKVEKNRFSIAGGSAGLEVSWQVTGIRQDSYAKAHPILVEEDKDADAAGGRAFVPAGSGARSSVLAASTRKAPTPRPAATPPEAPTAP